MKTIRHLLQATSFASLCLGTQASADMNTEDFTEYLNASSQSKEIALLYLNAAFSAFQISNLFLEAKNQELIFCMPDNFRLSEQQMADWVQENLSFVQLPKGSDVPVTVVLNTVLVENFPCN